MCSWGWPEAEVDEESRGAMLSEVIVRQAAEECKISVVESRSERENRKHERKRQLEKCEQWSRAGAMLILGSRDRSA